MLTDRILEILETHRGEVVSGQQLSDTLSVSRTAVWKSVNQLIGAGYHIHVHRLKGYMLDPLCDKLSLPGISKLLETYHPIYLFDEIDSTNSYLKRNLDSGIDSNALCIAEKQTKGKGRMSKSFLSPAMNGIYMSLLLPHRQRVTPQLLTVYMAVIVADAIDHVCGTKTQCKWVNDIMIRRKKICGILAEGVIEGGSHDFSDLIIGIGINTRSDDLIKSELPETADSIDSYAEKPFTRNQLIAEIVNRFDREYPLLQSDPASIIARYKERLFFLNETVTVYNDTTSYEAVAVDVNESGNLIIRESDGMLRSLFSGDISIKKART